MAKVKRAELLKVLHLLEPGLASKEIIEQGRHFVFHEGNVFTYNDEIAMRMDSPLEIEGAVLADPLLKLLTRIPDEELTVEIQDGELRFSGKRKKGGVKMEEEVQLPIDSIEAPGKFKNLPKKFCEAMKTVGRSCGVDESRFVLTCVHMTKEYVEACDNFQVTRYPLKLRLQKDVLLPSSSVRQLLRFGITKYSVTKDWAHFQDDNGVVFSCRAYFETYPSLDHFLDTKGEKAQLPAGLKEVVARAEVFSHEGDNQVRVELADNQLTLRGEGANGWYEETKEVEYEGKALRFRMAPELLQDVAERCEECVISENVMRIATDDYTHVACLVVEDSE